MGTQANALQLSFVHRHPATKNCWRRQAHVSSGGAGDGMAYLLLPGGHWPTRWVGAISRKHLKPWLEIDSGDYATIEALTHHANDDAERMIKGGGNIDLRVSARRCRNDEIAFVSCSTTSLHLP
jgi:hypothetical protein